MVTLHIKPTLLGQKFNYTYKNNLFPQTGLFTPPPGGGEGDAKYIPMMTDPPYLTSVLAPDHDVPVVQLHVRVRLGVEDHLGHDGAGRVALAEKQHVVDVFCHDR